MNSKQELKEWLDEERILFLAKHYGPKADYRRKHPRKKDIEWKFVISLRMTEYYYNLLQLIKRGNLLPNIMKINPFLMIFHKYRLDKLRSRYGARIPLNVFDKGLIIFHLQNITVSKKSKVGKYCLIFHNTTLGIKLEESGACPILGDGVTVCAGACILGGVEIPSGCTIGANAVVTHSYEKENVVYGGVPARIINTECGWSMLKYKESILSQNRKKFL